MIFDQNLLVLIIVIQVHYCNTFTKQLRGRVCSGLCDSPGLQSKQDNTVFTKFRNIPYVHYTYEVQCVPLFNAQFYVYSITT